MWKPHITTITTITTPQPGRIKNPLMQYGLELGADTYTQIVPAVKTYADLAIPTGAHHYAGAIHIAVINWNILPWDINKLLADEEQIQEIRSTKAFHTGRNMIREDVYFYAFIGIKENLEASYRARCESQGPFIQGAERALLGRYVEETN